MVRDKYQQSVGIYKTARTTLPAIYKLLLAHTTVIMFSNILLKGGRTIKVTNIYFIAFTLHCSGNVVIIAINKENIRQ